MREILSFLGGLRSELIYAILGAGAALENIVPPVPADTFVLLGGFLAGRGQIDLWAAYAVVWTANVGSALAVYAAGRRYGPSFFQKGPGRFLLNESHLRRMRGFFVRWGFPAIFFTRFLPGLRAVVPAFAGVSHQPFLPVALPLAVASAIWYGVLVWLGATAGRNLEQLLQWIQNTNRVLLGIAALLAIVIGVWWYRAREGGDRDAGHDGAPGRDGQGAEGAEGAEGPEGDEGSDGR